LTIPTPGSIVLYTLSEQDAEQINRRRRDAAASLASEQNPVGAQLHAGNTAAAGDVYPMVIVRVWMDTPGGAVNGQVLLDTLWVTSVNVGEGERHFTWPTPEPASL
jgi:hypothetical protein